MARGAGFRQCLEAKTAPDGGGSSKAGEGQKAKAGIPTSVQVNCVYRSRFFQNLEIGSVRLQGLLPVALRQGLQAR